MRPKPNVLLRTFTLNRWQILLYLVIIIWSIAMISVVPGVPSALGQDFPLPTVDQVQQLEHLALDVLGTILRDVKSRDTDRVNVVDALLQSRNREAVLLLAEVLRSDPVSFVRRAAAEGLANLAMGPAIPALRQAAYTDPVADIRWAAGVALARWSLRESEVITRLLSEPSALAAAAISLQDAAATHALPLALRPVVAEAITTAFPDRRTYNVLERAAMLKALAQMRDVDAIPLLFVTLHDAEEEPFVRGAAAFALGLMEVHEAVPDLVEALESDLAVLQLAAAGALGRLPDPLALEPLRVMLRQASSMEVRAAAATALSSFGAEALSALREALLTDSSPSVRQAALSGLMQLGGEEARRAVVTFLNSGYLQVCDPGLCGNLALETLVALARLGQGPLALQLLTETLTAVRDLLPLFYAFAEKELVRVLTEVGRVAPPMFDRLLHDESPFVQALGLSALANVQGRAARQTLLGYVSPEEIVVVRRAAFEGLSQWAGSSDVPLLASEITNRDRRTRIAALAALARVGDLRALQPLEEALGIETASIRLDAAGAALKFVERTTQWIAALNCIAQRRLPDRMLACFER
jgi:HEAT repeat protein